MTLAAWGCAAAIVVGSLLLGRALSLLGVGSRSAGPAVGLSVLIILSSIAIKLPGTALSAAIVLLVVVLAAAGLTVARRAGWRVSAASPAVMLVAAFGAAIPFIASGRVGLPGVSLDNDMASHLEYAEALRSPVTRALYGLPAGYPLGPHSLAATLATGLGARLDLAFTGLLIGTVIITALTGAAALGGEAVYKRVIVGVASALLYLVAAYYAEAAFKEQLMGLFVLAFALHLRGIRRGPALSGWPVLRALVPAALICTAGIYVYGYLSLAWFGLTAVIWIAAEIVASPGRLLRWRTQLRALIPGVVGAAVVVPVLLAPHAGRVLSMFQTFGFSPAGHNAITTSMRGNLVYALSPLEALGIWHSNDYRLLPPDQLHAGLLGGLALGVLVFGIVWAISRREFLLPAAVAACALIWWRSSHSQSIYVTAKALVIAGPVVAVTGLEALLGAPRRRLRRTPALSRAAVAIVFIVFAARSSYEALTNEPVWPRASTAELLSLDQQTRGHSVLLLAATDFDEWLFHNSRVSALAPNSPTLGQATLRPSKPNTYGTALDFDSTTAASLNHFQYVITTTTPFASQPPAAFHLVRKLPLYELWRREGTVAPRQAIDPAGLPGAVLDCHTAAGRALSRQKGVAAVMPTPVGATGGTLLPGHAGQFVLKLPAGRWELSLQYVSDETLSVAAAGRRWTMPAYLDRPGPIFQVGQMASAGGPITVTIREDRPSFMTGPNLVASIYGLVATRIPDVRTLVPLRHSCGRYIDWYRTDSVSSG